MATRPIPPHTAVAYDFCDVLDEIAVNNPSWAKSLASAAISQAAAYFPKTAKAVLGDQVATHKSAASKLPVKLKASAPIGIIDQALARLDAACRERAKMDGDAPIADYINKIAASISPTQSTAGGSLAKRAAGRL